MKCYGIDERITDSIAATKLHIKALEELRHKFRGTGTALVLGDVIEGLDITFSKLSDVANGE